MNPFQEYVRNETRRQFLSHGANAVGWAAFLCVVGVVFFLSRERELAVRL